MIFGILVGIWGVILSVMDFFDPTYSNSDGLIVMCLGLLLMGQAERGQR